MPEKTPVPKSTTGARGVPTNPAYRDTYSTVTIPSGTADGTTINIAHNAIVPNSFVFLQVRGSSGKKLLLDNIVVSAQGACNFTVRTVDAAATTAICVVNVHIVSL